MEEADSKGGRGVVAQAMDMPRYGNVGFPLCDILSFCSTACRNFAVLPPNLPKEKTVPAEKRRKNDEYEIIVNRG